MSNEFGPAIDPNMAATSEEFYGFGNEAEPEMEATSGDYEDEEQLSSEDEQEPNDEELEVSGETEGEPTEVAEPEAQEAQTPGAEKRIRGLVDERNDLREQNASMAKMLEELNRTMQAQQRTADDAQQHRQQQYSKDQTAKEQKERMASLKAQGFDETDLSHQLAFQALTKVEELIRNQGQSSEQQTQQIQKIQQQNYEQRYMSELDSSINAETRGFQVTPELTQHIKQVALEKAHLYRLNPKDAVKNAMQSIAALGVDFGKPQAKRKKGPPEEGVQVQRAVAKRAQTAGRKKGTASGSKKGAVSDPEAALFGLPDGMW